MAAPRSAKFIALLCAGVVVTMTGAAFAAVPLYRMFCQVTGFNGTTMKADKAPTETLDREVVIRFDTNVRGLPMVFKAEQVTQRVKIGETGIAYFDVTNTSDKPIQARASYNVVPDSSRMTVFSSGSDQGSRTSMPFGGQVDQAAAVSAQLEISGIWPRASLKTAISKNIQKKAAKNITSEAMNSTMP